MVKVEIGVALAISNHMPDYSRATLDAVLTSGGSNPFSELSGYGAFSPFWYFPFYFCAALWTGITCRAVKIVLACGA